MNFSECLKTVRKYIGCCVAFCSRDIMAIIDPLQKLSCLSNHGVVGWLCLGIFPSRDVRCRMGLPDFWWLFPQSVISANIPPWPVATEVNSGCISLPVCFQLVKSRFLHISWVVCCVLQQDYTCAAVKCEIRAEQDLPWETQAINCKTFKWRARRKELALG